MAKRKRIGLFYESYSTLPAFVIYIQNILKTLNLVDDSIKPIIIILHIEDSPLDEIKQINYPYIEFYQLKNIYGSFFKRAVNKLSRFFFDKNIYPFIDSTFPDNLDVVFPYNFRIELENIKSKIIWKPDFQEFHLPLNFTLDELIRHDEYLEKVSKTNYDLVLSSEDARRDYVKMYPQHKNKIHVLNFVSFLPENSSLDYLKKYKISIGEKYFIVANQFWPHKNHLNILKSLRICITENKNIKVIFTGKQFSHRDPELYYKLKLFIKQNNIQNNVIFTGFIERDEQISLMKNSVAVIQPSLFEGWSTVIEDAKALNKFVIASDISVNKEQLQGNVIFFNPYDFKDLANKIIGCVDGIYPLKNNDYNKNKDEFKNKLIDLFEL